jgi:peptidylprolyl isomerase
MPTDKRQRKRDGREARLAAERAAARAAARRRRLVTAVAAVLAVFAVLVLLSQTGGDDDEETTAADPASDEAPSETAEPGPAPAAYGSTPCAPEDKPAEPVRELESQFEDCLEDGVDYGATLTIGGGTVAVDLLEAEAPATVNNFVNLARSGFYDGSAFHRVIEGFVAQGGDPVGEPAGSGGPGYAVTDELPEAGSYQLGSVAMANSGPDTQGSQFFVVTGEQGVALPPDYSLFGTVTEGMDVVMAIEPGEPPAEPTILDSVEIVER